MQGQMLPVKFRGSEGLTAVGSKHMLQARYGLTFQAVSPTRVRGMTGAKGAACSERDGVIVPQKRQWPDAGITLVTRGGPSFLAHSVVVAYIAKLVKKTTFYFFYGMSDYRFFSDKAAGIVHARKLA